MEVDYVWMMNATLGPVSEFIAVVVVIGVLAGVLILIMNAALGRTRSGLPLYGRKHVKRSVDEIDRVIMHPEDYESQEQIIRRKERSRVIADQIITGKIQIPEEEFNDLFKSAFGKLERVDLDLAIPIDCLSPSMVLHCLWHDLSIGMLPSGEDIEITAEDEQRMDDLERILADLEAGSDTRSGQQIAVIVRAIEADRIIRRRRADA